MTEEGHISFMANDGHGGQVEILRLTSDGMVYKGQLVEDAGEALSAFTEWLRRAQQDQLTQTIPQH